MRKIKLVKRSIYSDPRTKIIQALAFEGFIHRVCAQYTGLTVGQVGYRLRDIGISTSDVRAGDSNESLARIRKILNDNRSIHQVEESTSGRKTPARSPRNRGIGGGRIRRK